MSNGKAIRIISTAVGVAALGASVVAGCGSDDDGGGADGRSPAGVFVGPVNGTKSYIAVISNGERVAGYLCDSERTSAWFAGPDLSGDRAELSRRDGEPLGEVTLAPEQATGTVEVAGSPHRFTAVAAEGDAGAYRAAVGKPGRHGSREVGWIVLADGSRRGATNISDGTSNTIARAPALDPADATVQVPGAGAVPVQKASPSIIAILIG